MCNHTQVPFSPDYSLKICDMPPKFSKSVREVVDYADTRFREYLCENGTQVESLKQKNGQKSRDTVPLTPSYLVSFFLAALSLFELFKISFKSFS